MLFRSARATAGPVGRAAEVVDDDLAAALGELEGVGLAETAAGSGDDGDTIVEADFAQALDSLHSFGSERRLVAVSVFDDVLFFVEVRRVDAAPAAGEFVLEIIALSKPRPLFQHHDRKPSLSQAIGHGAATGAAADDADVEIRIHDRSLG